MTKAAEYSRRYRARHPERIREAQRRWKEKNKEKVRDAKRESNLKISYGLSTQQYEALVVVQGGRCAVCKTARPKTGRKRLEVDHCHKTGQIRGLLCSNCNSAIGKLWDDLGLIRAAMAYVEQHRC